MRACILNEINGVLTNAVMLYTGLGWYICGMRILSILSSLNVFMCARNNCFITDDLIDVLSARSYLVLVYCYIIVSIHISYVDLISIRLQIR